MKQNTPYGKCDACGKTIKAGNAVVSITRNIEQLEHTVASPGGIITVIDSQQLITLCAACGNQFGVERATEVIQAALIQSQSMRN